MTINYGFKHQREEEIQRINAEKSRAAYYNELCRRLDITGPTINKYLTKLVDINILDTSWSEIEATETYEAVKTGKIINRTRKMWVRIFVVAKNNTADTFIQYLDEYNS